MQLKALQVAHRRWGGGEDEEEDEEDEGGKVGEHTHESDGLASQSRRHSSRADEPAPHQRAPVVTAATNDFAKGGPDSDPPFVSGYAPEQAR